MSDWRVFPCPACGTQPDVHVYSGCDRCQCGRYRLNRRFLDWDVKLGPVFEYHSLGFCKDPMSDVRTQVIIERSLQSDALWLLLEAEDKEPVPEDRREAVVAREISFATVAEIMMS
jgi:hypothetical protein